MLRTYTVVLRADIAYVNLQEHFRFRLFISKSRFQRSLQLAREVSLMLDNKHHLGNELRKRSRTNGGSLSDGIHNHTANEGCNNSTQNNRLSKILTANHRFACQKRDDEKEKIT